MSTDYFIYAEVQVGNKWYNLNPIMKRHDGTLVLHPIFNSCSWFYEIWKDLEDYRIDVGIPEDMSPELRSVFHENLDDEYEGWPEGTTWRKIYERSVLCVRYSDAICPRVIKDRPHQMPS